MNNLTSSFSLYEILRILLPGFYTTIMLKQFIFDLIYMKPAYSDQFDGWVIFIVLSVLLGGLLYSLDIPRWFRKLYSTLPSNLIEKQYSVANEGRSEGPRYYENKYYKFYHQMEPATKFTTEFQTGFFHLFVVMTFIGLCFTLVYGVVPTNNLLIAEYRALNISVFLICLVAAIVIYKRKLKYTWKWNYELFVESQTESMTPRTVEENTRADMPTTDAAEKAQQN